MAGMASGIVTCPLDVIKTKLQAQGSFSVASLQQPHAPAASAIYRGLMGTARTIVRQDGLKGMYRGLGPMLLGYLPTWAVYMAVYDGSREWFVEHRYGASKDDKWLPRIYASLVAGACSTVVTNPIWVIKTRLMSQVSRTASDGHRTPWHYNNTLDAARKMYRSEGIAAFYSGLAPALLGLTHVAIQFPLYEYFKQQFTGLEMGAAPANDQRSWTNVVGILSATLLSKVCATSATYPHEVLRTRLQTQQRNLQPENTNGMTGSHHSQKMNKTRLLGTSDGMYYQPRYQGVISTCRVILREEGWRAFYNGMGTNMIRAVPAAMTTMLTFESMKTAIARMQDEGRELLKEDEGEWRRVNRKWS
jgi:solute carrier family 25 (mitochondrial folate transporter), member 32